MGISTKKGDEGYTRTLRGDRVPKYHLVTEAVGTLDETNSLLGLARAAAREKRIKRIILQIQKHMFVIAAEVSSLNAGKQAKKIISEKEVGWLENLVEDFEEALSLPPGFVAFGQNESASKTDIARTSVRKAERVVSRMKSEGMIGNTCILKYLNRLSDLLFLIACFEEKHDIDRKKIGKALFSSRWSDPLFRKLTISVGSIIISLITIIILILLFHKPAPDSSRGSNEHMQGMERVHQP